MVKVRFFVLRGTSCAFISTLMVCYKVNIQLYKPLPKKRELCEIQHYNSHTSQKDINVFIPEISSFPN